ncbi:hypothetical protein F5887DRAFT_924691 [Amanita rubescens]|nr:hypothetical protein F5887DRAFT_924691 [Amanita rubescens]
MNLSTPSLHLSSWKPETRQQNHTRRPPHRQISWHNDLRHNHVHTGSDPETVDISLDVSSIVLSTLRDASKFSPVPLLSAAAGIAVNIVGAVQKARRNKDGFKVLADDSCELVYVIIRAYKDRPRMDDLVDNLQQLVTVLASIQQFAQKGASRSFFTAIFRSGVDAEKIQRHRDKLQQSMRVFGLQSDIALRETVAKLVSRRVELDNGALPGPSSSVNVSDLTMFPSSNLVRSRADLGTMTVSANTASEPEQMPRATTQTMVMDIYPNYRRLVHEVVAPGVGRLIVHIFVRSSSPLPSPPSLP